MSKIFRRGSGPFFPAGRASPSAPVSVTTASAAISQPFAKAVLSTLDEQDFSMYQRLRQLFSRFGIHALHRGTGDRHLRGAILLREALQINEADGFIFIHCHAYKAVFLQAGIQRSKAVAFGEGANLPPFSWSCHHVHLPLCRQKPERPPAALGKYYRFSSCSSRASS